MTEGEKDHCGVSPGDSESPWNLEDVGGPEQC